MLTKKRRKKRKKGLPRLELGSRDSESLVITITPQAHLVLVAQRIRRVTTNHEIAGSNPAKDGFYFFFYLIKKKKEEEEEKKERGPIV